jgi:hypothetical protein
LAGEPTADDIDGPDIAPPQSANVVVDGDAGPAFGKDGAAVGFDFAEGDGSESGALKAEAEAADPAE